MKKYLLIFFIVSLILLAGCGKKDNGEKTTTYYGGTEGVSISFKKIAPPDKFDQGEDIPIAVILKNSGEYDIVSGNAKAKIYGINHETFNLQDKYLGTAGELKGKNDLNVDGGEREISFGNMKYIGEVINSRNTIIRARVCYPYQTKTDMPICIKSSLAQEAGESVCSIEGEKVSKGTVSSAPVQVTSVVEKTIGKDRVRFDIKLKNSGTGIAYSNDATCDGLEDELTKLNKKNKVSFEVINPSGVSCGFRSGEDSNKGEVELDADSEEIVSCWVDAEETYTEFLKIVLSYMYTDTTQKEVTIYEKN